VFQCLETLLRQLLGSFRELVFEHEIGDRERRFFRVAVNVCESSRDECRVLIVSLESPRLELVKREPVRELGRRDYLAEPRNGATEREG